MHINAQHRKVHRLLKQYVSTQFKREFKKNGVLHHIYCSVQTSRSLSFWCCLLFSSSNLTNYTPLPRAYISLSLFIEVLPTAPCTIQKLYLYSFYYNGHSLFNAYFKTVQSFLIVTLPEILFAVSKISTLCGTIKPDL